MQEAMAAAEMFSHFPCRRQGTINSTPNISHPRPKVSLYIYMQFASFISQYRHRCIYQNTHPCQSHKYISMRINIYIRQRCFSFLLLLLFLQPPRIYTLFHLFSSSFPSHLNSRTHCLLGRIAGVAGATYLLAPVFIIIV